MGLRFAHLFGCSFAGGCEIWNAPQIALFGAGAKGTLRTGPSLEVIRQSETFGVRPLAKHARWDLLSVPGIGNLLRQAATRRTLQALLLGAAGLIVLDGLWGPQISPINLAGVLPWIHWRGVLVIGLLVAGNFFCLACPFTLPRNLAKRLLGGTIPGRLSCGASGWPQVCSRFFSGPMSTRTLGQPLVDCVDCGHLLCRIVCSRRILSWCFIL